MITDEMIEIAAKALWRQVVIDHEGTRDLDAEWHSLTDADRDRKRNEARAVLEAVGHMIRRNALEDAEKVCDWHYTIPPHSGCRKMPFLRMGIQPVIVPSLSVS